MLFIYCILSLLLQVFSLSRDEALPFYAFWHHTDTRLGGPVRAIWLSCVLAFILGIPGLTNKAALGALFSLTATGLYSSYVIPIFLRCTLGRKIFKPAEFNLGSWSIPMGIISVLWATFMLIVLCLPQASPITVDTMNYSPIVLGAVLCLSITYWYMGARKWFKGIKRYTNTEGGAETPTATVGTALGGETDYDENHPEEDTESVIA